MNVRWLGEECLLVDRSHEIVVATRLVGEEVVHLDWMTTRAATQLVPEGNHTHHYVAASICPVREQIRIDGLPLDAKVVQN